MPILFEKRFIIFWSLRIFHIFCALHLSADSQNNEHNVFIWWEVEKSNWWSKKKREIFTTYLYFQLRKVPHWNKFDRIRTVVILTVCLKTPSLTSVHSIISLLNEICKIWDSYKLTLQPYYVFNIKNSEFDYTTKNTKICFILRFWRIPEEGRLRIGTAQNFVVLLSGWTGKTS